MKKIIITLAAIAAAFTFASCEKDNTIQEENNGKTVLYASTADVNLTKTELSSNYQVLWTEYYDVIQILPADHSTLGTEARIQSGAGTTEGVFSTSGLADGSYIAYYPAECVGTDLSAYPDEKYMFNWTWTQNYVEGSAKNMPMAAEFTVSGGVASPLKFKNLGGILRLKVKNTEGASLKSIVIDDGFKEGNNKKTITLNCNTAVALSSSGTEFLISMPAKTYSSNFNMTFTRADGKTRKFTMSSKPMVINRNQITDATISVNFDAPIVSSFQVNASGKKVIFSKGNLYWDGDSYEFEDDQLTLGYNDNSHVCAFYFSSNEANARSQNYSAQYEASDEVLFTNETETTANPNFTVAGETGKWRTLSYDEFVYLRNQTSLWSTVLIGDKFDYIPVLVLCPAGVSKPTAKSYITLAKWQEYEAKGCVAFPLSQNLDGGGAYYWTSSSAGTDSGYINPIVGTASSSSWNVNMSFYSMMAKGTNNMSSAPYSIRLVKDK